ncbi:MULTISPECIES: hypothetical protein [unclassified Microbacterium]|uniref:hypothetical protein n=1 Tax=unclassified Microbacterium TaxID=2609290 RepID=UPI00214D06A8|nr:MULTISPECIES: hypothetical protein [unclassified Microbacterium]MCR2785434.1 hypothetical protein [Microbacterium sp. zg.B96]WIM14539.1 hypothetical protein QNO11_08090 [Microbacterium sp. zg-B96]
MAWNTLTEARAIWRDAPASDPVLTLYLESAHSACLAYAPSLVEDPNVIDGGSFDEEPVPATWKLAEVMQARNIWNSVKASPGGGEMDGSSYGITAFPLDWQVKQLLRPERGLGAIA